jgi:hypothetical protein
MLVTAINIIIWDIWADNANGGQQVYRIGQGQVLYTYTTDVIYTKGNNSIPMQRASV